MTDQIETKTDELGGLWAPRRDGVTTPSTPLDTGEERPYPGDEVDHSAFSLPLGVLAEEYGIPLAPELEEYRDRDVRIDHEGGEWHVGGELVGLTDEGWAPTSDAQAAELRAAVLVGAREGGPQEAPGAPLEPAIRDALLWTL